MWHLRDIFVSGTYLAIMCKEDGAVGCNLVDMDKYGGSLPLSIMAVWCILAMWQPYMCHDVSKGLI